MITNMNIVEDVVLYTKNIEHQYTSENDDSEALEKNITRLLAKISFYMHSSFLLLC